MTERRPATLPGDLDEVSPDEDTDVLLEGAEVTGDLADAEALGLTECRWAGGRLTGLHLHRLICTDVVFEDCDLSGVIAEDSSLCRVEFHRCRMSGIVLAGSRLQDVLLSGCRVDSANLRGVSAIRFEALGSDLRGADLFGATLTSSRVHDGDLTGADFSRSTVEGLRLHGTVLRDVVGAGELRGAVIAGDQQLDVAMSLFDAAGITVDDER